MHRWRRTLGIAAAGAVLGTGLGAGALVTAPAALASGGTYYATYDTAEECHDAAVAGRRAGEWYRYNCRENAEARWDLYVI